MDKETKRAHDTHRKHTPKPFWGYICDDCAKGMGAVAPDDNYVTTYHQGKCDQCGHEKGVCHTRNWLFPEGTKYRELE